MTLTGSGGVGKTRLAIAVLDSVVEDYPDGVWFADLSSLDDPGDVMQMVASSLGIKEEPGQTLHETLRDHLQDKDLLLVLDNCEHLIDACSHLLDGLRDACPRLDVLATSRQPLHVVGEQVWRVPALSFPDVDRHLLELPDHRPFLLEYEAVQLFVDRAVATSPDFRLTRENAEGVGRLCSMLDGIPFAIELAAAWVRLLSVEQIAARVEDRLALLIGGRNARVPRRQTVRATLDWSYDLLSEPARAVLHRLSVFAGGCSLEAVESVCAGADDLPEEPGGTTLNALAELVDASLVLYVEEPLGQGRYRLLETTRQYAAVRLRESSEEGATQARHCNCFLALAKKARDKLLGPEQARWLQCLAADYENLRIALDRAMSDPNGVESGLLLAAVLSHVWAVRGHYTEGRERLASTLVRSSEPSRIRADALAAAGRFAAEQNDYPAARDLYQQACVIWRDIGEERGLAGPLRGLGNAALFLGETAEARDFLEGALTLDRRFGERGGEARDLTELGIAAKNEGDFVEAFALQQQALLIAREMGDMPLEGRLLHNLGNVVGEQGVYDQARAFYEKSLDVHRRLGNRLWMGTNLFELGAMAVREGDDATACPLLEQALSLSRDAGDPFIVACCLGCLGYISQLQGEAVAARHLRLESLRLFSRLGVRREIASTLQSLGWLELHQGQPERGARLAGAGAALRVRIKAPNPPDERPGMDVIRQYAKICLGEKGFAAAWAEGLAMSQGDAVAYALR